VAAATDDDYDDAGEEDENLDQSQHRTDFSLCAAQARLFQSSF
jgi:hypothetical protein